MAEIVAEAERPGGPGERESWVDVLARVEPRHRLALAEAARAEQAREVITPEWMMVVLGAILAVLREHATDRAALARISACSSTERLNRAAEAAMSGGCKDSPDAD